MKRLLILLFVLSELVNYGQTKIGMSHIVLVTPTNTYKKIIIYDMLARKVKEFEFKEQVDVSNITAGSYRIIISSKHNHIE